MSKRREIVAMARSFIGTPFQHQGRLPGTVLDCIGTAYLSGARCGIEMPPCPHDYERVAMDDSLVARLDSFLERVDPANVRLADVACFRIGRFPQHLGVKSGTDRMIHAWTGSGKVAEDTIDAKWQKRLVGWWRFPGLPEVA